MTHPLQNARRLFRAQAWRDAHEALASAWADARLAPEDLERLAVAAYLSGRDEASLEAFEHAHQAWAAEGEDARATRCAFWLGLQLLFRGEVGRATGWLARADRLLDRIGRERVESGYLQLPTAERALRAGRLDDARAAAARAVAAGVRFGEPDLLAAAQHLEGRILLHAGNLDEGLARLDEAMVAVTSGELSPIMTGLLYCSVLDACGEVYALGRAREWTAAMGAWCERQPQLAAFTGTCRVHRSEVMLWSGDWREAIEEARAACGGQAEASTARAFYQQGEVHRLEGRYAAAEDAYGRASAGGCEPQPGLALLRLAEGRADAALGGIRRVVQATRDATRRTRLLPAYVEILLATGHQDEAEAAAGELEGLAERLGGEVVGAMAAQARGAVLLASGEAAAAIGALRAAQEVWQRVDAPYPTAQVRALVGRACAALGDDDGSRLETDAARALFERLGARPDAAALPRRPERPSRGGGLTGREREVLALVAEGHTNRDIARQLGVSGRTVDRHVSNIFAKLAVSSRAAATARAYEQHLL